MGASDLESFQTALGEGVEAILLLRSEISQREARMSAAFNQQIQALRQEVTQFRRDIAGIAGAAGEQIAQEAKEAVSPVAAEYDRAVSATSAQLQSASKMVWMWFGAAGAILVLVLLVGWAVVGYYRSELAAAKDEFQRYRNAADIAQAFYASDAVICGGRICSNDDPNGERAGNKRQYRQAKVRPQ
jgi:hypothetical protein